jgi:ribosomal protein S18 acetylase RimI-like enzyme
MLVFDHAIRQAMDEGAVAFDCLRGREAYKYRWGAQDHPPFDGSSGIGVKRCRMMPNPVPLQHFIMALPVSIRQCRKDDLPALEWFGMFTAHRNIILAAYESQERGEAVMLVAEVKEFPIGQVWIDLTRKHEDATGILWAVRVLPPVQNLGLGTRLMAAAEHVLRNQGFTQAELVVEKDNPNAKRFYERQGYHVISSEQSEYTYTTPDGIQTHVSTDRWVLRKPLV